MRSFLNKNRKNLRKYAITIQILMIVLCGWTLNPVGASLQIVEVMPDNKSAFPSSTNKYEDWIELKNTGAKTVDMSQYGLSDSSENLSIWKLPKYELEPNETVLIFANDGKNKQDGTSFSAPFKLSASGECLYLYKVVDNQKEQTQRFEFPALNEDQSYGIDSEMNFGIFNLSSPGKENSRADKIWYTKSAIEIQPKSGLHSMGESVQISIKSIQPGITVHYTNDGTNPMGDKGKVWDVSKNQTINETTILRFAFVKNSVEVAPQVSRTYLFHGDLFKNDKMFDSESWPENWGRNATYYGPPQELINEWGWDKDLKEAFTSIPSYSLIIDNKDLFDFNTGIYANAPLKGRDWERRCLIEYIDTKNNKNYQANAGVRIRGGFSRSLGNPKHSVRFFFRTEYGEPKFKANLFGDENAQEFDHLDLRCSQNYSWSFNRDPNAVFVRDQFNRDIQLHMGQQSPKGDFCHLFINGMYWGLYNSCERPEASFGNTYFKGKKKDFDVIKSAGFNWAGRYAAQSDDRPIGPTGMRMHIEATDGNMEAWKALWDLTQFDGGLNNMSNYLKAIGRLENGKKSKDSPALLNAESLIDYMLVILAMGNRDAPLTSDGNRPNNWYAMRSRSDDDGFRFFVWDAEHSALAYSLFEDRTGPWNTGNLFEYSNPQYFWEQCLKNKEFRFLVKDRVYKHFNPGGSLTSETLIALWTKRSEEIYHAVVAESARWGSRVAHNPFPGNILNRDTHWVYAIENVAKHYLPYRPHIIYSQLQAQGLTHKIPAPLWEKVEGMVEIKIPESWRGDAALIVNSDGKDPRKLLGAIHGTSYDKSVRLPHPKSSIMQVRLFSNGKWGPKVTIQPEQ